MRAGLRRRPRCLRAREVRARRVRSCVELNRIRGYLLCAPPLACGALFRRGLLAAVACGAVTVRSPCRCSWRPRRSAARSAARCRHGSASRSEESPKIIPCGGNRNNIMTTLDDKLLGEKLQYYYSSSEGEDEDSEKEDKEGESSIPESVGEVELSSDGSAVNTGPKGVINDWRRFKQLETEQRQEQRREMERLIKKLSMTCRSHLDEETDKQKQKELQEKINGKMTLQEYNMIHNGEDDEEFLQRYRKQRMEEMRQQLYSGQQFKQVFEITSGEAFLDTVDKEHKSTLIMIHIYEDDIPGAESLNGCMICLAAEYPTVKFCRVKSSLIGASARFTNNALPALLVYKAGELIGNFVRITDQLGEDFFAVDLEAFLQECGLLPEKDLVLLTSIHNPSACYSEDSDLEID